jgi:hypothetical protein
MMFAIKGSSRTLRRLQKSTGRRPAAEHATGTVRDFDWTLEPLCQWAIGMPWVTERVSSDPETLRQFMINCRPLSCHEPWFAIMSHIGRQADWVEPIVVLPETVARRGFATGWPIVSEKFAEARPHIGLEMPICPVEFAALQQMLTAGYCWTFASHR